MKIVIWITLFCLVAIGGAATLRSEPGPAPPTEVRIVTSANPDHEARIKKLEADVKKLEPAVKTIEEHLQRKGSRF